MVFDRTEYINKMNSILQTDKFVKLGDANTKDRTLQEERALQAFLLHATKRGDISREIYNRIRPVGTTRPRLYGVPKLHKDGVPLRPILSMINSPYHETAIWLAEVLHPVVNFIQNIRWMIHSTSVESWRTLFQEVSTLSRIPSCVHLTSPVCLQTFL